MIREVISSSANVLRKLASRLRARRTFVGLVAAAIVLVAAGFAWRTDADDVRDESQAAINDFWAAYQGNDYAAIPRVQTEPEQALAAGPRTVQMRKTARITRVRLIPSGGYRRMYWRNDRSAESGSYAVSHLFTSVGRKRACWWDGEIAPYSFEGYMLNLGRLLVLSCQSPER